MYMLLRHLKPDASIIFVASNQIAKHVFDSLKITDNRLKLYICPQPLDRFSPILNRDSGKIFRYDPPLVHKIAWAFVYDGSATVHLQESFQEIIVFSKNGKFIEFCATTDCRILVGSSIEYSYPLIAGYGFCTHKCCFINKTK